MNRIVFDIEANGLSEIALNQKGQVTKEADTVHCLCLADLDSGDTLEYGPCAIEEGVQKLREANLLVGHNIIMYDLPVLERLYGPIDTECVDTLVVSRVMYPDKGQHPLGGNSLEAWGKHLEIYKGDYAGGWEAFSEEMMDYCKQDVQVNKAIYLEQLDFMTKNQRVLKLEHIVTKIISEQTTNGFGFDLEEGRKLLETLDQQSSDIEQELCNVFPPIVEERWSEKTGNRLKDKITVFNPGSRQQIASRLHDKYGWNPPLTEKGNPKVDESVLKKLNYPEAKQLVTYFGIIKLRGQVNDWVIRSSNSRDGRIHGSINPQGTVTGRMTASQPNLQQVSGDSRARKLFKPKKGWVQVGIDAKGLEARMLANRMAKWDNGEYGKVVVEEDAHALNQAAAGLSSRSQAKTFFYGFIYGAGDAKIGQIINQSASVGKMIKERFLQKLPALKKAIQQCKFQVNKKGTIELLDGREVPCRSVHSSLNVQLQGDGAVVMKLAQCIFDRKIKSKNLSDKVRFMATVHDEWQVECDPTLAALVGQMGCDSISESGKRLGCVVPLDGDYQIGACWADCH